MFSRFRVAIIPFLGLLLLGVTPISTAAQDGGVKAGEPEPFRTWTWRSGDQSREAAFVDFKEGKVTLKTKAGTVIPVALDRLSDADQQYVRQQGAKIRVWTDRSGTHKTEAAFIDFKDGKVTLKKKDGTDVCPPLDSLSDADQRYVKQWGWRIPESEKAAAPPSKGPTKPAAIWKLFTHKQTGKAFTAKILEQKSSGGAPFYFVEDENGHSEWIRPSSSLSPKLQR